MTVSYMYIFINKRVLLPILVEPNALDIAQVVFLISARYQDGSSMGFLSTFVLEIFTAVSHYSWHELSLCMVCGFLSRSDKRCI